MPQCPRIMRKSRRCFSSWPQKHVQDELRSRMWILVFFSAWRKRWRASAFILPCRPKPIRTILGGFWNYLSDSNSKFVVAEIRIFEGFEFLVRSCECAVACLCPRNSISNVVASVIHDDKYIHIHETIVEGQRLLSPNIMESV